MVMVAKSHYVSPSLIQIPPLLVTASRCPLSPLSSLPPSSPVNCDMSLYAKWLFWFVANWPPRHCFLNHATAPMVPSAVRKRRKSPGVMLGSRIPFASLCQWSAVSAVSNFFWDQAPSFLNSSEVHLLFGCWKRLQRKPSAPTAIKRLQNLTPGCCRYWKGTILQDFHLFFPWI